MTAGTQPKLLEGRSALITGASSGIGAAAARIFCREGAAVTLVARREKQLADLTDELQTQGHHAQYVIADVTHTEQIAHAVQQAITTYGHLDTAFNNAGIGATPAPLHLLHENIYDTIMDTNVRGIWNSMRHEIPAMLTHGHGTIINNSSTAGLVATPVTAPYIASKHAVIGLTKAAAYEYATHNIRINAIAPGTTQTEMITNWLQQNPTIETTLLNHTPLPRHAHPNEIAEAAAWLSSNRASYIHGTTLSIDGGWTTH
ncbi:MULTISPECIES: SDR family NAD(P)-dependent oxidoreductase [unclassified Streptomyces]|uniref:SDR family NAD(P)-dependent oxidoreductase n=1 Tax=unclassified Streptomyces TaxID=2593676 RepID=UPI0009C3A8CD|nr:glucose 1-dehydrogenase [Streptomyces sp. Sge12]ARE72661.1 short-chain dehydrogenase [Streptomyces sp. Sge12]ARE78643.1 short-chain dehydrogenase [Streptomyces sp. Sge12]